MEEFRKLCTILFADLAGYTSILQRDEQYALGLLDQFKEILEAHVSEYQGNLVQYFGDGCLLSFESATVGVDCALALQTSFIQHGIPVRIGMHLGEVLFKNNNAFGDGVNIASRVESMGIPGSIIISQAVRDQIKNKKAFHLASLGSYQFKNVDAPMNIYALANEGLVIPKPHEMKGKLSGAPPNFFQRLWQSMVLQILSLYVLLGWLGMNILDWAFHQLEISPHWPRLFFVVVIGLIPSLIIYLINRERIHRGHLKLSEKILFPSNLAVLGGVLFLMFRSADLGATTKEIEYVDANGIKRTSRIIKQSFRQNVVLFDFEGQAVDSSWIWLNSGIKTLLWHDVSQDKTLNCEYGPDEISLANKVEGATGTDFFVDGTYALTDSRYTISPRVYVSKNGKLVSQESFSGKDLYTLLDSVSVFIRREVSRNDQLIEASTDLPLKEFTSSSLVAIKHFCEGSFASLERAIEVDSTFALASFYLGKGLFEANVAQLDMKAYLDLAFRNRQKLPIDIQYSVMSYRHIVYQDLEAAEQTLKLQLAVNPESDALNNNLVLVYHLAREYEKLLDFTEGWFERDYFDASSEYANALLLNSKTDQLLTQAKTFLRLYPKSEFLLYIILKAQLMDQDWEAALEVLQKIKLIRPELEAQFELMEQGIRYQKVSGYASDPFESFQGTFRIFNSERTASFFLLPTHSHILLFQSQGTIGLHFLLDDQQIFNMGRTGWGETEAFSLAKDSNNQIFGIKVKELTERSREESHVFLWKLDSLILQAESLLEQKNYEQAEKLYENAILANPTHFYLQEVLKHIQYVKTKTAEELHTQFQSTQGTYGDRNFWVEKGRFFYKRRPFGNQYFPQMELLPISENRYIILAKEFVQHEFEFDKGKAVANYTHLYHWDSTAWYRNSLEEDYKLKHHLRRE